MERHLRRVISVTCALAILVPASAGVAQSPMSSGGAGAAVEGIWWQLTAVAGAADAAAVPGMKADLLLSDGRASGFGGCNQFTTSYTLDGESLTFAPPASTGMACAEAAMAFESFYLGALPTVASYHIAGETLRLLDGSGAPALTYGAPAPVASGAPAGLVGTWTVTQLNNGNQGVETVPAEPVLRVTFHDDETVEGFGGCNGFGGPYVLGQDTIGVGPLSATTMTCGDAVDGVEQRLLTALQASTAWSLRGDQVELRDTSGALQVGLVAGSAPPAAS